MYSKIDISEDIHDSVNKLDIIKEHVLKNKLKVVLFVISDNPLSRTLGNKNNNLLETPQTYTTHWYITLY